MAMGYAAIARTRTIAPRTAKHARPDVTWAFVRRAVVLVVHSNVSAHVNAVLTVPPPVAIVEQAATTTPLATLTVQTPQPVCQPATATPPAISIVLMARTAKSIASATPIAWSTAMEHWPVVLTNAPDKNVPVLTESLSVTGIAPKGLQFGLGSRWLPCNVTINFGRL